MPGYKKAPGPSVAFKIIQPTHINSFFFLEGEKHANSVSLHPSRKLLQGRCWLSECLCLKTQCLRRGSLLSLECSVGCTHARARTHPRTHAHSDGRLNRAYRLLLLLSWCYTGTLLLLITKADIQLINLGISDVAFVSGLEKNRKANGLCTRGYARACAIK